MRFCANLFVVIIMFPTNARGGGRLELILHLPSNLLAGSTENKSPRMHQEASVATRQTHGTITEILVKSSFNKLRPPFVRDSPCARIAIPQVPSYILSQCAIAPPSRHCYGRDNEIEPIPIFLCTPTTALIYGPPVGSEKL